jgi:nitroreductase
MTHPPTDPDPWQPRLSPESAQLLMHTRQTILPKRLHAPGPNAGQLLALLAAATTAPDHDQLRPWRFVQVPDDQRTALGEVFAQALHERDHQATPEQLDQAREKALRAPLLLLLVVDAACGDADIDLSERLISAGCAVQNMLLMATAQGFGSALTSGKALKSSHLRAFFGLADQEHAPCFISVGTAHTRKPGRPRPQPADLLTRLGA